MTESFSYVWLIPCLPLLGAFINVFCNRNPRVSGTIACAAVAVSFVLVLGVFLQLTGLPAGERSVDVVVYSWITAGTFSVDVAFLIDPLSTVMMLVVTGVGLLIHVYSIGYMGKDTCCVRYFSYLNLFMFAMLILVMGNNFLLMFVGWEGVGLCSYLLIGFWCERQSAANAGMKAFVVNRVGDFAFILGLLLIFLYAGSLTFADVFATDPAVLAPVVTAITLLLFIGAMGKSAQVPFHVWLPDAMEGPTPVSALIHAATMVTAGVYMVARCHTLFVQSTTAMTVVAVIGAVTAIFAAYIALTQYDIKRILAYSTISQLGYMFLACGVGYFSAGIFHLVTHAFFKALLFMGAGSVIHALEHAMEEGRDPQDLRNMGGLGSLMPVTYKSMLLATLAIAGIAPFAGFFSKDLISLGGLRQRARAVGCRTGHRGDDFLLHVPVAVHGLWRQDPPEPVGDQQGARVVPGHGRAAGIARHIVHRGRLHRHSPRLCGWHGPLRRVSGARVFHHAGSTGPLGKHRTGRDGPDPVAGRGRHLGRLRRLHPRKHGFRPPGSPVSVHAFVQKVLRGRILRRPLRRAAQEDRLGMLAHSGYRDHRRGLDPGRAHGAWHGERDPVYADGRRAELRAHHGHRRRWW